MPDKVLVTREIPEEVCSLVEKMALTRIYNLIMKTLLLHMNRLDEIRE